MNQSTQLCAVVLVPAACGAQEPADTDVEDPCRATELEPDFVVANEENGPGTWEDIPRDAIVAATYLRLNPDNLDVFDDASAGVFGDLLSGRNGLLHLATASSQECGIARTLTVWESEAAMMSFVVGEAHLAAIEQVSAISRGGSITDSWEASELPAVDFASVAAAFENHQGPVY